MCDNIVQLEWCTMSRCMQMTSLKKNLSMRRLSLPRRRRSGNVCAFRSLLITDTEYTIYWRGSPSSTYSGTWASLPLRRQTLRQDTMFCRWAWRRTYSFDTHALTYLGGRNCNTALTQSNSLWYCANGLLYPFRRERSKVSTRKHHPTPRYLTIQESKTRMISAFLQNAE